MRTVPSNMKRLRKNVAAGSDQVDASAHAWRVLEAVARWITHADAKAAVILGSSGVIGGVLFNMVRGSSTRGAWADAAAVVCSAFLVVCATCASIALRPRRGSNVVPSSLIYFDHVARQTQHTGRTYVEALTSLLQNADALTEQIGLQVWSVSMVASAKYRWVDRALLSLLAALSALGLTALAIIAH